MSRFDTLLTTVTEVFGEEATAEQAYDLLTVDVPPASWIAALTTARDELGCTYFDWLSAVDEPGTGFRVCAHVVSLADGRPRRLLLRTTVPHGGAALPTAVEVYAGAAWHERETHEMFGVDFTGHPHLVPLLLPENFEGHPLRKDFVLAARVAKAWPGAKEPGESHDGAAPKRRQMLPPGVPDPNEWGPLKGQLPPAPARPARAAADRPARRPRPAAETPAATGPSSAAPAEPAARPPRRTRSASEGSASQAAPASAAEPAAPDASPSRPPRRTRSAADGSASQARPAGPEAAPAPRTRSSDAPWHHARPAFEDAPDPAAPTPDAPAEPGPEPEPAPEPGTETESESETPTRTDPAGGDPA
ncbi:NADH-quinone oxidoreductase subunit C [Streptomyces sp. NPDC003327]